MVAAEAALIIHEVDAAGAQQMLSMPDCSDELAACDVAAFVFDSSSIQSFRSAHELVMQVICMILYVPFRVAHTSAQFSYIMLWM